MSSSIELYDKISNQLNQVDMLIRENKKYKDRLSTVLGDVLKQIDETIETMEKELKTLENSESRLF